ncbi:FixH family protein [Variovorax sp. 350MFTsu5.1]|uniref:FixH family protein n=1 Tax=Variovorax sp. 350MFTsu5.1 TaxID=3158365 RepID=UPI003AAA316B
MNAATDSTMNALAAGADKPWWRHPLLWMVIGGPVAVMIASFVTFWLAWRSPDALVSPDYYREGVEINKALAAKKHLPALTGRNHAMTPAEDVPSEGRKAAP